jgi:glucokinase
MTARDLFAGVDLGSTKTAVSLWGADSVRLGGLAFPTLSDPHRNFARVVGEARDLVRAAGGTLRAVGVSAGGPLDAGRSSLLSVPNLPGWEGVPVRSLLEDAFQVPVGVENDANACALAEWRYGAGRGVEDLAFLTCSTGIGAGLILGGRLHRGSRNLAGEVGHVPVVPEGDLCGCGKRGCLEAYASGAGIARRLRVLREADPALPSSARELTERARTGDAWSRDFLAETARLLARGLTALVYIVDPQRIVLGTIAVGAGELLLGPLREELRRLLWPAFLEGLDVVPAALGEDLGDRAALAVAEAVFCTSSGH